MQDRPRSGTSPSSAEQEMPLSGVLPQYRDYLRVDRTGYKDIQD